ncbi:sulfotransferase [Argonema galeatum]|uniref:sulfotransferase n=1 Tax=Argonema galeatum TaxID=2942762 RepID=UPI0020122D71|nr:sulfotransferase [Argonema galeatum]MCL1465829.1 sulfotransferase [Argonema galeatum A003/A1]
MGDNLKKAVFICGAGHSGSTLLGLILGSHSDCFYCGEGQKTNFLQNQTKAISKRVCKICGANCPVWSDLKLSERVNLYEQISAKAQKPIIIDSSKGRQWLQKQLESLKNTDIKQYLIFLQRDGRAVINSRITKYPEKNFKYLIEEWVAKGQMTNELFNNFDHKKIKIRYEVLATQPESVTQKLCNFLDIEYQPEMLKYYEHEHHPLGGNNGTQFLVAKAQREKIKDPFVKVGEYKKDYYENHELGIKLDLRWQKELDPSVERLFEEMAGKENAEMKWEV